MKTNLDALYKTDASKEKEGFWYHVNQEIGFLIRRFGGKNAQRMKEISANVWKPHAKRMKSMTIEENDRVTTEAYVRSCVVDWKGIEVDAV